MRVPPLHCRLRGRALLRAVTAQARGEVAWTTAVAMAMGPEASHTLRQAVCADRLAVTGEGGRETRGPPGSGSHSFVDVVP